MSKRGVRFTTHVDPVCRFKDECFAKKDCKCTILHDMPQPRKGHKCPFCKKDRNMIAKG